MAGTVTYCPLGHPWGLLRSAAVEALAGAHPVSVARCRVQWLIDFHRAQAHLLRLQVAKTPDCPGHHVDGDQQGATLGARGGGQEQDCEEGSHCHKHAPGPPKPAAITSDSSTHGLSRRNALRSGFISATFSSECSRPSRWPISWAIVETRIFSGTSGEIQITRSLGRQQPQGSTRPVHTPAVSPRRIRMPSASPMTTVGAKLPAVASVQSWAAALAASARSVAATNTCEAVPVVGVSVTDSPAQAARSSKATSLMPRQNGRRPRHLSVPTSD